MSSIKPSYRLLLGLLLVVMSLALSAQQDTLGRYAPGFKFRSGIYYDFESFRENCPSIPLSELKDEQGRALTELKEEGTLYHMVDDTLRRVEPDSVYGYCKGGQVFLEHYGNYDRLVLIGSIGHIVHSEERLDQSYSYSTGFDVIPVRREVQVEFLIDMDTGVKEPYTQALLADMISDDSEIYAKYSTMSNRKKKESKFSIIHTYNRAHPIYFKISRCLY